MSKTFAVGFFVVAMLVQAEALANIPSYYSSPPSQPPKGNASTGSMGSNPNIVTGDHFSHTNPFAGQSGRRDYDINSNETTIDNTYSPTIQLDCSHDDSCLPPSKDK